MAKKSKKKKDEDVEEFDDWDEDDWDDDFEDEDEKPKKSKKSKKKKSGKTMKWIVAFIIILAILLFIRFKQMPGPADIATDLGLENKSGDTAPLVDDTSMNDTGKSTDEYIAPAKIGKAVVQEGDLPDLISIDVTETPELFSNLECKKDESTGVRYISLRIYNTLKENIKISPRGVAKGYNTFFKVRGLVDMDPGCGTELLRSGEFTECTKIGLESSYANVVGINRLSVTVPGKTEALLVECK